MTVKTQKTAKNWGARGGLGVPYCT